LLEAVAQRVGRESRVVPAASEALLLRRGDRRTIAENDRRAVVVVSGNSEDVHRLAALEK